MVGQALAYLLEIRLDEGEIGHDEAMRRLDHWWKERREPGASSDRAPTASATQPDDASAGGDVAVAAWLGSASRRLALVLSSSRRSSCVVLRLAS